MPKYGVARVIDEAIMKKAREKERRNYLGMSEIGEECLRKLWYSYRDMDKVVDDARVQRIFRLGDHVETIVVGLLKDAGLTVYDIDPDTGKEYRVSDLDDKYGGGIDGVVVGLPESAKPHLLEIKSASNKRFNQLLKSGYEEWDSKYKAQIHSYMHYFKLDRCLVVVYNKDTSELYFERIPVDPFEAEVNKQKAQLVISSEQKLDRAYKKKNFKCNWCKYKEGCWS